MIYCLQFDVPILFHTHSACTVQRRMNLSPREHRKGSDPLQNAFPVLPASFAFFYYLTA